MSKSAAKLALSDEDWELHKKEKTHFLRASAAEQIH